MKINFNSFHLGCNGGNRFIFELSNALWERGHQVTICHAGLPILHDWFSPIRADIIECNIGKATRLLNKYGIHKVDVHAEQEKNLVKSIPDCDVNVATYFTTVRPTLLSKKGKACYLVQHYEPSFFSSGNQERLVAEATYSMPLQKLCVSQWLTEKVNGAFIGNGINLSKFKPLPLPIEFDVMVMPKPNIKWKGNYAPVVDELRRKGLKVLEVNNLSEENLVRAYNLSKCFLYLSEREGFGFPPLEAMACGTPVISTDCTEYFKDYNSMLQLKEDWAINDAVTNVGWLLKNPDYAKSLVGSGLKLAGNFAFSKVVDRFVDVIQ